MAENPLRSGDRGERVAPPAVLVIFGSTGDLTHRKLLPAVYNLALDGLLPAGFAIVGVGRRAETDASFRDQVRASLERHSRRPLDPALWSRFAGLLRYCQVQFDDPEGYLALSQVLAAIDQERGTRGNRVFYLSVPPSLFR
ncbi:MAG: hypothetical protein U0556_14045 [Dehalococcoidia bacterium]